MEEEDRGAKGEGGGESSRQQIGIWETMGEGGVLLVAGEVLLLLGGCSCKSLFSWGGKGHVRSVCGGIA